MIPSWKALGLSVMGHVFLGVVLVTLSARADGVTAKTDRLAYTPTIEYEIACTNEEVLRIVLEQWVPLDEQGCTILPSGYRPDSVTVMQIVEGLCEYDLVECPLKISILRVIDGDQIFYVAYGWAEQLPFDIAEDLEFAKPLPFGIPCPQGRCTDASQTMLATKGE